LCGVEGSSIIGGGLFQLPDIIYNKKYEKSHKKIIISF